MKVVYYYKSASYEPLRLLAAKNVSSRLQSFYHSLEYWYCLQQCSLAVVFGNLVSNVQSNSRNYVMHFICKQYTNSPFNWILSSYTPESLTFTVLNKKKVTVPESLLLNIHIVSLLLMGVARARIPQFFRRGGGPRVSLIVYVMLFSI